MLHYIIWNITPDLRLGAISIHLYSLFFAVGLLLGGLVVISLMQRYKTSQSYFVYAFLGIVVGARLFHCFLYEPNYYLHNMLEVISPFANIDGKRTFVGFYGISSHGGTIGLMLALWLFAKRNRIEYLAVCDVFAIATPLTATFIRIGNLMNSEILGLPTNVGWAFVFKNIDNIPRHPAQLYEAIWYLLLFVAIFFVYKKIGLHRFKSGFYLGVISAGVALFRFFVEFFKEQQEAFEISIPLNVGQILSIPFFVMGIVLIVYSTKKNLPVFCRTAF